MQLFKLVKDVPQCGHAVTVTTRSEHERNRLLKDGWSLAPDIDAAPVGDVAPQEPPAADPEPAPEPKKRGRPKKDAD